MATEDNKFKIDVDVITDGADLVSALTAKLGALESRIKSINASMKTIGSVSSSPGGTAKDALAAEAIRSRSQRSKARADSDSVNAAQRVNFFDRESVKIFQTKLASQSKAATEALRAERQTFANFRNRNVAQAVYETTQVRALKDRLSAERRISSMRVAYERATASAQARTASEAARATTRRMQDAANAIRATARLEEQETRRADRDRTSRESARNRNVSNLRSGGESIREGTGRAVRGAAAVSAVATGTAAAAARKGISSRIDVDTAETNLKIFSGQTNEQIKAARKGFLDNLSIKNGLGIAGGLDAYSEVLKTGMKAPAENVKTIMEAVSALEIDLKNTTKLAGLIDRNYGAKSDPAKIKSALNAVAVAAREDPTQSNEIVEGVKRSFGALSTGNMTPEQLTALVSGGQSVGIQPGKAGTYVATLGKQLSMGNSKFLGKKNREELNFAARELGFGDARKMASEYNKDSYGTVIKFHENLAKLSSGKRTQVAEAALGRQWSDEGLQYSGGVGGVKKTYAEISDSKNANFLEEAARQRAESLQGQWKSTKTIFGRFWDSFGAGFEDILTSINKYILELNSTFDYDKIKSYVVEFFDGVKEALGVKTWQELLHNVFGGNLGNIGPQIKAFAKGLTEGVMSIGRAIRGFASIFGGSDMSAETVGEMTGKFLALSLALAALSPVIGVLSGLAAIVGGIATSAAAISALGTMGGGASAAAGAAAVSGWTLVGTTIAAAFVSYLLRQAIPKVVDSATGTKAGTAIDEAVSAGGITGLFGTGLNLQLGLMKGFLSSLMGEKTPEAPVRTWGNPASKVSEPAKPSLDPRLAIEGLEDAVNDNTLIHKQSFEKQSAFGGLIHRASISTTGASDAVRASLTDSASGVRQAMLSGSTGAGTMTGGAGPLGNSVPGSALSGGSGLSRRGIIGGGGGAVTPSGRMEPGSRAGSLTSLIEQEARAAGIDPRIMHGIRAGESGHRADYDKKDDALESSWGPFQLNRKRGLGQDFEKETGLDVRNPATIGAQAKWVAQYIAKKRAQNPNWNPGQKWMGYRGNRDSDPRWGESGYKPDPTAGSAGVAASLGAGAGQYDGLRVKGGQAVAGGAAYGGVTDLARKVQESLPGGVKHFSAFNDRFHQGRNSKHNQGLAFDTSLIDGSKSVEAAEAMRNKLRAAGLTDKDFRVIDEYKNPSSHSTGGHIHSQFNNAEAAKKYSDHVASLKMPAQAIGDGIAAKVDGIKSSGWKPGLGNNAPSTPLTEGVEARKSLADGVPNRNADSVSGAAGGAGGSSGNATTNYININGSGLNAEEIANAVQRKTSEGMRRQTTGASPYSMI